MASAAGWLRRGALLVIDYGFPRREFYHPQRRDGTLMCHFRHHAHGDPLWLPGANDITAHVDFSAVADAAHDAGLDVLGYTTQARFLLNCGLLELSWPATSALPRRRRPCCPRPRWASSSRCCCSPRASATIRRCPASPTATGCTRCARPMPMGYPLVSRAMLDLIPGDAPVNPATPLSIQATPCQSKRRPCHC